MKRRILALVCMLAVLVGIFAIGATAATDSDGYYQVGYSKMDINPWIQSDYTGGIGIPKDQVTDENDSYVANVIEVDITHNGETVKQPIVSVPLSGYSNAWSRISDSMIDDNGDGVVGIGDGLFTTCTVVVDPNGSMVFFFTLDAISAYDSIGAEVRNNVVAEIAALGGTVTDDRIMITGSHSHTGAYMDGLDDTASDVARCAYYDYIVSQMTQAAVNAYQDSQNSQATMKKRELDVSEDYGYQMNWVRHVEVPFNVKQKSSWFGSESTVGSGKVIYGSNFGFYTTAGAPNGGTLTEGSWGAYTKLEVDTANRKHVAEADDTLQLLTFEFEDDRDPIVLVNWRGHPDNIGGNYISSDYIGSLRYRLEENKTKFGGTCDYRVGFYQGASGNINIMSVIESEAWVASETPQGLVNEGQGSKSDHPFNKYGYMLAEAALLNLEGSAGTTTTCDVGRIVNRQIKSYAVDRQIYTDEEKQAAQDLATAYSATTLDAVTAAMSSQGLTFPYTGSTGGVLNSKYHWEDVYNQSDNVSSTVTMEIGALMIGSDAAFVLSDCELFDRYDANQSTLDADNDWLTVVDEETYGTPFIFAYTNGHSGYISNTKAYHYNEGEEYTGYNLVGTGSYEANTSVYAEGTGEKLVAEYAKLLDLLNNGFVTRECPECGMVEWQPLCAADAGAATYTTGHYYLYEDFPIEQSVQRTVTAGHKVCIDLNGHTVENGLAGSSQGRFFTVTNGSTLTVIDSVGTGKVISHAVNNNPGGGLLSIGSGTTAGTMNIYGGEWSFENNTDNSQGGTGVGGVAAVYGNGTLNVYGGTIHGADMVSSNYTSSSGAYFSNNGSGGAIYMYAGAKLNVYGGSITSGSVPETVTIGTTSDPQTGVGMGPCVFMAGSTCKVNLYNNANVEDIYYRYNNGSNVTVSGTYTGTTGLSFHSSISLQQNLDIGNAASGADISGAKLTCTDTTGDWSVKISGTNLVLQGYSDSTKAVIVSDTTETEYDSLAAAVKAYSTGYIKLIQDDSSAVSIGKDTYLDLNGCDVTGTITVSAGTLYCMDSMTDDYTVNDSYGYGKLSKVTGSVAGIPVESTVAEDGYLMVTETAGISFHRVNLKLTHMTLRQRNDDDAEGVYNPGVYYKALDSFAADEIVAAKVQKFGIAMSATAEPTEANLSENCECSWFTGFAAGNNANSASGTLLRGVMKETNPNLINRRNANTTVYGKAYILTEDGYMFGECVGRSFRKQVEDVDAIWSSLTTEQKELTLAMYQTYSGVMNGWDIPNILAELESDEYKTLKVLVVGNSHGLDATNLLYEVFKTEAPDQKVVIGALYYSGCNINQHANFMKTDSAAYDYYKNGDFEGANADGSWTIVEDTTAQYGLADEQWDIVVMQQMNHRAAYDATAENNFNKTNYQYVINYINDNVKNGVEPKLAWHMVWTNPDQEEYLDPDSTLSHPTKTDTAWVDNHNAWFPGTDGTYDQSVMYQGIVDCLKEYIIDADNSFLGSGTFEYILPSALAVEYAQDVLGCTQAQIYRDYTHMNDYGRLMTAYVWYAELMGMDKIPAVSVGEIPAVLHHSKSTILETNDAGNYVVTDDMKKIIRKAVNFALENPEDYAIPTEEDNTISILGIGNSYTIDSLWMLGEVYQAENPGKTVQLGIAYKSGETLAGHVTNINAGEEGNVYDYLYWDTASDKWTVSAEKMTLEQIIADQAWEMVSMQQGSGGSGVPSTMNSNIDYIQNYVIDELGYAPTFLWNMTWAYPEEDIEGDAYDNTTRPNAWSFENYYGSSQATMYKAIMETVQQKILPNATFDYLMPVGTAIQNANGTVTDHELYRDYTHLSDISRLMAAYTWYCELEMVTLDEIQLTALPTVNLASGSWYNGAARDLTADELTLVINSVKDAMKNNFTTTDESVYAE